MTWRPLVISIVFLSCASLDAKAHSSLVEASPQEGATVSGDAIAIRLRFDSRIDPRFSALTLYRPDGGQAALTLQAGSPPAVLEAAGTGLGEGRYLLRWRVLGVDGHASQGQIHFNVGR